MMSERRHCEASRGLTILSKGRTLLAAHHFSILVSSFSCKDISFRRQRHSIESQSIIGRTVVTTPFGRRHKRVSTPARAARRPRRGDIAHQVFDSTGALEHSVVEFLADCEWHTIARRRHEAVAPVQGRKAGRLCLIACMYRQIYRRDPC